MTRWRLFLAGLTAPFVGITAITLLGLVGLLVAGVDSVPRTEVPDRILHVYVHVLAVGLPIGYAVEFVVGLPAYQWLKYHQRLRPLPVIIVATAAGVVGFGWLGIGSVIDLAYTVALGMFGGAIGGVFFWLVGFAGTKSESAV